MGWKRAAGANEAARSRTRKQRCFKGLFCSSDAEGLVVLLDDRIQIRSDRAGAEKDKIFLKKLLHPGLVFDAFADRNSSDRKSTRLNSSHSQISYAVFCLKKKTKEKN